MSEKLGDIKLSFRDRIRQRRIIKRLKDDTNKDEWLRINHTFNRWEFPPQFYDLIPEWWTYDKLPRKAFAFLHPIMKIIDDEFSRKEQLRFHNVAMGDMSNAAFEYWYNNCSIEAPSPQDEKIISEFYNRRRIYEQLEWWTDEVFYQLKNSLHKS